MDPKPSVGPEYQADIRQDIFYYRLPPSYEDEADETGEKIRLPLPALELLREARGRFFRAARAAGLNAHQALHTWNEAVQTELENSIAVVAMGYCTPQLADALSTTPEEIQNAPPDLLQLAIQSKRSLAEVKAEIERQWKALEN